MGMAVLPGVLGCRPLRRTVQVRLGTKPAVPWDELLGLATAIHEISGLNLIAILIDFRKIWQEICIRSLNLKENRSLAFGTEWMAACSRHSHIFAAAV